MSSYGRILRKVTSQKIKYGNKVLTDQGILSVQLSIGNIFNLYNFLSNLQISTTFWSGLTSSFLFGINLNDIIPDNINFQVDLPNLQQWLNGVQIILKQINLGNLLQNLNLTLPSFNLNNLIGSLSDFTNFVIPPISINLQNSQLTKAYYNVSAYGLSYYDPTAVRNFLRSTVFSIVVKNENPATIKNEMEALKQSLNIADFVADDFYNRLIAIKEARDQLCLVDYCFVGYSIIPEETNTPKHDALLTFQTYDGRKVTIPVGNVFDLEAVCYVDLSYVGYCAVGGDETTGDNIFNITEPSVSTVLNAIHRSFVSRINTTPLAVANYQTEKAREDPHNSERVAYYGLSVTQLRQLDYVTENVVRQIYPDIDSFTLRQYKVAVENLYGTLYSVHKWGNESQQSMTQDQLQQYWIQKWTSQGLDPSILSALWNATYPVVRAQGKTRTRERLNFLKKKLYG